MATPIYLQAKDILIADAKTARFCLSDAVSSMNKVEKAVSGWDLYIDAAADGFIFMESEGEILSCLSVLKAKQDQLASLVLVLQTETDKIEDADAGFKNEITDPSFWERLANAAGRALYSSVIWPVNTVIAGAAWLGCLFGSNSIEQGNRDQIEKAVVGRGGSAEVAKSETEIRITDYEQGQGVNKGEIRWVYQGNGTYGEDEKKRIQANGWGSVSWSSVQCNSACESMALSYMGIDKSPGDLTPAGGAAVNDPLDGLEVASYGTGDTVWCAPDGSNILIENRVGCDMSDIDNRIAAFEKDCNKGDVAPVMVRYYNGDAGHWILLVGKNPDGTYQVIGPQYGEKGITVTIDSYGNITSDALSHHGGVIHRYAQYSRQ